LLQLPPAVNNRVARRPSGLDFLIGEISSSINGFKTVPPRVKTPARLKNSNKSFPISRGTACRRSAARGLCPSRHAARRGTSAKTSRLSALLFLDLFERSNHLENYSRIPQLYVVLRIFNERVLRYHCPFAYGN